MFTRQFFQSLQVVYMVFRVSFDANANPPIVDGVARKADKYPGRTIQFILSRPPLSGRGI